MTLIINEIRINDNSGKSFWISAADRRLSMNGKFHSTKRKKIFPVVYLNATVSYFGLAVWTKNNKEIYLSDIIKRLITKLNNERRLNEFSKKLISELNNKVPNNLLKTNPTGIHISGFDNSGVPQFYYSSNIGNITNEFIYQDLKTKLSLPSNDLERDMKIHFGLKQNKFNQIRNKGYQYRNGDIRSHVLSSEKLNELLKEVFELDNFKPIDTYELRADYLKFKFDFIANLYRTWSNKESIGKPIDLYVIFKDGIFEKKNKTWQAVT